MDLQWDFFQLQSTVCVNSYVAFVNTAVLPTPQISDTCKSVFWHLTFFVVVVIAKRLSVAVITYGNKNIIVSFSFMAVYLCHSKSRVGWEH